MVYQSHVYRAAWCSACSAQIAAARRYCAGPALVACPPDKGRSYIGHQMRMAPLMTTTLAFAAGTAVLLLLAHRLSPRLAAQPMGFPACKAEVMLCCICNDCCWTSSIAD